MGRPSIYTDELAVHICGEIAKGNSLRKICLSEAMPNASTVHLWVLTNEAFSKQYAIARAMQAEHYLDEIIEIADESSNDMVADDDGNERVNSEAIARSRLRVDTRKWAMSKMLPKKYGDKVDLGIGGTEGAPPVQIESQFNISDIRLKVHEILAGREAT